jgi:hypothetical protein
MPTVSSFKYNVKWDTIMHVQLLMRLRQEDHLCPGYSGQPRKHSKTPFQKKRERKKSFV